MFCQLGKGGEVNVFVVLTKIMWKSEFTILILILFCACGLHTWPHRMCAGPASIARSIALRTRCVVLCFHWLTRVCGKVISPFLGRREKSVGVPGNLLQVQSSEGGKKKKVQGRQRVKMGKTEKKKKKTSAWKCNASFGVYSVAFTTLRGRNRRTRRRREMRKSSCIARLCCELAGVELERGGCVRQPFEVPGS